MTEPMPNPLTLSVLAEAIQDEIVVGCCAPDERASREIVTLILTTIEKAGYKVVPVECTQEMADAMYDAHARSALAFADEDDVWSAMLSAAPHITEED